MVWLDYNVANRQQGQKTTHKRQRNKPKIILYRRKVKKDASSVVVDQTKEDSHKKHPSVDFVNSAIK